MVLIDQTPFYGESGGQIGDTGQLYDDTSYFLVENTKKYGQTIGHIGKLISGEIKINNSIYTQINQDYRREVQLNHSATHLLHAALRQILGNNVTQKGSLVTNTHLRFDFSYFKPIEMFQLQKIEYIINMNIRNNIEIKTQELNLEEAKKTNAIALFENQYSSIVRVVSIRDFSIELCGGTHTKRTGDIGLFKIISQSSIASGIKRIEAMTGQKAINYLHEKDNYIQNLSSILNCNSHDIKEKIKKLIITKKNLEEKVTQLQTKENKQYIQKLLKNIDDIQGTKFLLNISYNYEHKLLRTIVDRSK